MESQQKKVTIYYDGLCNLCSGAINTIAESTQKERFTVFDVTNGPLPPNVSREEALRNMYAVDTEGRLYKGADAVLKILEEYPNSRWISYIGRMPVVRQLAALLYWFIARNRYWMFGRKRVS